jgi:hypothetical protein
MSTAKEVAQFMADEFGAHRYLYQETIVFEIISKFGKQFTGPNVNGNLSPRDDVLQEFFSLASDPVWIRGGRYWRKREDNDDPGRTQP